VWCANRIAPATNPIERLSSIARRQVGPGYNWIVLLFELFPAFMAILSVVVGVGLYISHRRARHDPPDPVITVTPPPPGSPNANASGSRRPSMSA
jgi:hypothetical protein